MTLAGELIDYAEGLIVSQGEGAGDRLQLLPWEKRFIRGAFRAPSVTSAALSIARANGKTCMVSAIAAATLDGPLRLPRGETIIVASSFAQARIAWEHVLHFLAPAMAERPGEWRVLDSMGGARIVHRPTGASVRALGSDPRRLHGLAPSLVLADEPAQWPDNVADRMLAALVTAGGKQPGFRFIALGTRSANPESWFSKMLDGGADYVQVHATDVDADPFSLAAMKSANPSWSAMPNLRRAVRADARRAQADSSMMASYRALRLNQGVADHLRAMLLDAHTWEGLESESVMPSGEMIFGVELGGSHAMSAITAFTPASGWLESLAAFPEQPDLLSRGRADAVGSLYVDMQGEGELIQAGERTVDVSRLIAEAVRTWGLPDVVVADRWRAAELENALVAAGLPSGQMITRGMGFRDGAEDVRLFRRACLDRRVRARPSLLLRAAMAEAVVVSDPAGNAKLSKGSEGGRRQAAKDDAVAAAILAIAEGERRRAAALTRPVFRYHGLVPV